MLIGGLSVALITTPVLEKRRLAGCVTIDSVGASKRVIVQKRSSLEYVASTYSNIDGTWEIRGIHVMEEGSLMVLIIDDAGNFDPIAFDNVSQVE